MKKIIKKLSGLMLVLTMITVWGIQTYDGSSESILASSSVISSSKIEWGIKRAENHNQPDLRKEKYRTNAKI